MSEKLLRCKETAEFVSYSESESKVAIEAYRNSEAQKEIVQHACALKWAKRAVRAACRSAPHRTAACSRPPDQRSMPPVPPGFLNRSGR
jgi:hypothetical protein